MKVTQYKLVVTVPVAESESMRKLLGEVGAGKIGNYTYCSFTKKGVGRSLPQAGANPTIGTVGRIEEIEEEQIETNIHVNDLQKVIDAIKKAHSYEEPIIDVYPLVDYL